VDSWRNLAVNRLYVLEEGGRILKTEDFAPFRKKS